MILEFIKRTESKRKDGKFHNIGDKVTFSDDVFAQKCIDDGNAKRINNARQDFLEEVNKENIKEIKKQLKDK